MKCWNKTRQSAEQNRTEKKIMNKNPHLERASHIRKKDQINHSVGCNFSLVCVCVFLNLKTNYITTCVFHCIFPHMLFTSFSTHFFACCCSARHGTALNWNGNEDWKTIAKWYFDLVFISRRFFYFRVCATRRLRWCCSCNVCITISFIEVGHFQMLHISWLY